MIEIKTDSYNPRHFGVGVKTAQNIGTHTVCIIVAFFLNVGRRRKIMQVG